LTLLDASNKLPELSTVLANSLYTDSPPAFTSSMQGHSPRWGNSPMNGRSLIHKGVAAKTSK